jgi:hypothetical protein
MLPGRCCHEFQSAVTLIILFSASNNSFIPAHSARLRGLRNKKSTGDLGSKSDISNAYWEFSLATTQSYFRGQPPGSLAA